MDRILKETGNRRLPLDFIRPNLKFIGRIIFGLREVHAMT
jgi:hypothetical protein